MNFSAGNLLAGVIFGSAGVGADLYGKKSSDRKALLIGIALLGYPFFIHNFIHNAPAVWIAGILLTAGLFIRLPY